MKRENLARMSAKEIDEYAKALGIRKLDGKSADDKIAALDRRLSRVATIDVLGLSLEVPVKALKDKRVSDLMEKPDPTDTDCETILRLIIGDEQFDQLVDACTEDDGYIDVAALGYAFTKVITSPQLKNF